jgi:hypothetical protein
MLNESFISRSRKSSFVIAEGKEKEGHIDEKTLYKEEDHDEVSLNTYKKYIKACGGYTKASLLLIFILLTMGLGQGFQVVLGYWTQ